MALAFRSMAAALMATAIGPALAAPTTAPMPSEAVPPEVAPATGDPTELAVRIDRLIEQLGAPDFTVRERAQAELARIGMEAFDAVFQAQQHDDIEVAHRARHLVRSMRVGWVREDDPETVKAILEKFPEQELAKRAASVERLAELPSGQGIPALCRVARFDASIVLSKRAALLVIRQSRPNEAEGRSELARQIGDAAGLSRRTSVQWLRAHAQTVVDPESGIDRWQPLIEVERRLLAQRSSETNRRIVRDLVRYRIDWLSDLGREQQAVAAMYDMLELIGQESEDLYESIDWLRRRNAWAVIDRLGEKLASRFGEEIPLQYVLVESAARQGNAEKAEEIARHALDRSNHDDPKEEVEVRMGLADELQTRGLIDGALRELRRAVRIIPVNSELGLRTRSILASLLHEQQFEREAAETLEPLVERIDSDPEFVEKVVAPYIQLVGQPVGTYKSRMHYYRSLDAARDGRRDERLEHLERAVAADPTDADVLIGMYRIPNPTEAHRQKTMRLIGEAAAVFEKDIAAQSTMHNVNPALAKFKLGIAYNQYAWLIGNTEGDTQKALEYSKKSNKLRPESGGLLDTLGRCYYAVGDLENAVKEQTRAAELEPYSAPIIRQLKFFKQELAKSKAESGKPKAESRE